MKIKKKAEILKALKQRRYFVIEALEVFDNRVLHGMRKRREIRFDVETREYFVD